MDKFLFYILLILFSVFKVSSQNTPNDTIINNLQLQNKEKQAKLEKLSSDLRQFNAKELAKELSEKNKILVKLNKDKKDLLILEKKYCNVDSLKNVLQLYEDNFKTSTLSHQSLLKEFKENKDKYETLDKDLGSIRLKINAQIEKDKSEMSNYMMNLQGKVLSSHYDAIDNEVRGINAITQKDYHKKYKTFQREELAVSDLRQIQEISSY